MGRAGRHGCVHVTPDLTRHVASDESSCLTSLSLKRDRQPLLSAHPPTHPPTAVLVRMSSVN